MKLYVNAAARRSGNGTEKTPFSTINEAAQIAKAGDEVIVYPGIYREYVDPANGGTEEMPVVYRSLEPRKAVITGSEQVTNWEKCYDDTWITRINNGIFGDYNPYTTVIFGDWYFSTDPVHTGEVYLNGKAMYETFSLTDVLRPAVSELSWEKDKSLFKWYTTQDENTNETIIYANFGGIDPRNQNIEINVRRNCFFPSKEGTGHITVSGFVIRQAATQWAPPTAFQDGMIGPHWSKGWIIEDCEISDSRCSGISLGKYLQPENDNKWFTKYQKDGTQTQRDAICQAQRDGWSKETIGSHIIRRCDIHHCGQTGIVGHMGCVFSLIEDNHIHHINNKQDLAGAEIGGIKLHAAIDVIIRRNHIHHCTRGIWLDWQAQGTRVTQNLFYDNTPPAGLDITPLLGLGEDIFIEVSHGPTLVDNNLMLSLCAARISTQGIAFVHNLIAGSFTWVGAGTDNGGVDFPSPRYTPYHVPHRTEIAGFMTILHGDARFLNNIFLQQKVPSSYKEHAVKNNTESKYNFICGTIPYDGYPKAEDYFAQFVPYTMENELSKDRFYSHMPVYTGGNVYLGGARPCDTESALLVNDEAPAGFELIEENGHITLKTELYRHLSGISCGIISTETLGEAFEPEQRFENPDGSQIIFNQDYYGQHRGAHTLPGPFEDASELTEYLF